MNKEKNSVNEFPEIGKLRLSHALITRACASILLGFPGHLQPELP
jgi:hypothetical protein